jgi:hypothetical protein
MARAEESREGEPVYASNLAVVLRLDRSLPWMVVQWLLQDCVDPNRRIWRIHFAVLPEGEGEEGTLACRAPKDRGLARDPTRIPDHVNVGMRLSDTEDGSDPALLFERMKALLAEDPTLLFRLYAAGDVPVGKVLEVVDVLYRSGVTELTVVGEPARRGPDAIRNLVAGKPRAGTDVSIFLSGRAVVGDGNPAPSLPAVKRVVGRPAHLLMSTVWGGPEGFVPDE